jgi:hypothetical protein
MRFHDLSRPVLLLRLASGENVDREASVPERVVGMGQMVGFIREELFHVAQEAHDDSMILPCHIEFRDAFVAHKDLDLVVIEAGAGQFLDHMIEVVARSERRRDVSMRAESISLRVGIGIYGHHEKLLLCLCVGARRRAQRRPRLIVQSLGHFSLLAALMAGGAWLSRFGILFAFD